MQGFLDAVVCAFGVHISFPVHAIVHFQHLIDHGIVGKVPFGEHATDEHPRPISHRTPHLIGSFGGKAKLRQRKIDGLRNGSDGIGQRTVQIKNDGFFVCIIHKKISGNVIFVCAQAQTLSLS